jgi:uncharacterized protein (DUF2252 family)
LKYPSFDERRAFGRSRRHVVQRSTQARWEPSRRKHDPLEVIRATNRERISELVPLKMARMAASPFGFYRGSVELMAADLALLPVSGLCAQICGDAHVRNLGAFAAPDGRLLFDLNDFDETIYGPWEWDVKRLAVSLVLAGREGENSDAVCRQAVRDFMRMYRGKMLEFAELPVIEVARYRVRRAFRGAPGSAVLRKAERATPQHWLKTLTVKQHAQRDSHRVFAQRKPLLTSPPKSVARQVLAALHSYRQTVEAERRHILDFYRPQEVAFKVVGLGSVGLRDYVVLCFGSRGAGDPLFLQLKEERASVYARYLRTVPQRLHQGRRVVEGQRRMQLLSDLLLGWTSFGGGEYLVRQLADHKAEIENKLLAGRGLTHYALTSSEVLAKAHARSGDPYALAGYLGKGEVMDQAVEAFAVAYADQVTLDYEKFRTAIRDGKIRAARDPLL